MGKRCPTPDKVKFASAWDAGRVMTKLLRRSIKPPTNYYRCGDHWHLTTKARR